MSAPTPKNGRSSWFPAFAVIASISVALIPLIRLIFIYSTTGADNPSNDEWYPMAIIFGPIMDGHYHWAKFFQDIFYNGHLVFFPILAQLAFACFFHMNYFAMLVFGILLSTIQIYLVFDSIAGTVKDPKKWFFLPIISWLTLSVVQVSVFEFAFSTIQHGMYRLGLFLAIWSLTKFAPKPKGVILSLVGAFFSCWSAGSGIVAWPVVLIGFLLMGYRRLWHYIAWLIAASLSGLPFVYFLLFKNIQNQRIDFSLIPKPDFWFRSIGLPVAMDFTSNSTSIRGIVGLVIGGIAIILLARRNILHSLIKFAPSILLIISGILGVWVIGLTRENISSWYSYSYMSFWLGLSGLAFNFWNSEIEAPKNWYSMNGKKFWSFSFGAILIYFIASSNLTWENKSFFLSARSPVSASCLRHYWEAPTYCEGNLFLWGVGNPYLMPSLGEALQNHDISVFGPQQRWSLQGDSILQKVHFHQLGKFPKVYWTKGMGFKPTAFTDYHHLNLFFYGPDEVDWTITLPNNLTKAEFHSAVLLSKGPQNTGPDGTIFQIKLFEGSQDGKTVFLETVSNNTGNDWIPFTVPLERYKGKTITLKLSANSVISRGQSRGLFRYPYVDVSQEESPPISSSEKPDILPENTDLSPSVPKLSPADVVLNLQDLNEWNIKNAEASPSDQTNGILNVIGQNPSLEYKFPLDLNLADYTHLSFQMSAPTEISPRRTRILFKLNNQPAPLEIWIPLLKDGNLHRYTYDLKVLGLPARTILNGISIEPASGPTLQGQHRIEISDLRFLRRDYKFSTDEESLMSDNK